MSRATLASGGRPHRERLIDRGQVAKGCHQAYVSVIRFVEASMCRLIVAAFGMGLIAVSAQAADTLITKGSRVQGEITASNEWGHLSSNMDDTRPNNREELKELLDAVLDLVDDLGMSRRRLSD
jgi:hypothetical protein